MAKAPKNIAASVRQRLLNLAREQGRVFEFVLVMYGLERLIYRLSISEYRQRFVLKGGMLVTLWTDDENRVTRDADFLLHGESTEEHLKTVFTGIFSLPADDGLEFDTDAITIEPIRENQEYGGLRLKTYAYLERTRIPITVDIGVGDAVADPDFTIDYPSLLDAPIANIRAYPPATVLAEKFHAMVTLGMANSRMKDYYDLWALPNALNIAPADLDKAIQATFERRRTEVPGTQPAGLSTEFASDAQKVRQWAAYTASIELENLSLDTVVESIWKTIGPACKRLTQLPEGTAT